MRVVVGDCLRTSGGQLLPKLAWRMRVVVGDCLRTIGGQPLTKLALANAGCCGRLLEDEWWATAT